MNLDELLLVQKAMVRHLCHLEITGRLFEDLGKIKIHMYLYRLLFAYQLGTTPYERYLFKLSELMERERPF